MRLFSMWENRMYRSWNFVEIYGISLKILMEQAVENDVENVYNLLYYEVIVKFM